MSGEPLDPKEVRRARMEEMAFYQKMDTYELAPVRQCLERTGKPPIPVRWIDINKGDKRSPKYRSRLVAKQYNDGKLDEVFAATPPIEALRGVISSAVTGTKTKCIMVNDVSRAYMYAQVRQEMYVALCDEARETVEMEYEEPMCWKLKKSMYGTRPAASNWQEEFTSTLRAIGFSIGKSSPCVFEHEQRDLKTFVHGDDFVTSGDPDQVKWLEGKLMDKYAITTTYVGDYPGMAREARILNRIIRLHPGQGITIEADPRHVEIMVKDAGLEKVTGLKVPAVNDDDNETEEQKAKDIQNRKEAGTLTAKTADQKIDSLNSQETTLFRALVARANFLSIDRPDIMYSVRECARRMASPTMTDWNKLVRLIRYLKAKPRLVIWYKYQEDPRRIMTYTDSDWAGCRRTRRSTMGGVAMYGTHLIRSWCKTQAIVALSSAEAELYGIVKASSETLGICSMMRDIGIHAKGHIMTDASAALGIVRRKGLGRVRHLETNLLWIQDRASRGDMVYGKVPGEKNMADIYTKPLTAEGINKHVTAMGCTFAEGKDDIALSIHHLGHKDPGYITAIYDHAREAGLGGRLEAWSRVDIGSRTYRTTMKGGPKWSDVVARITMDARSGEVLCVEGISDIPRSLEHGLLRLGPRDIETTLLFRAHDNPVGCNII